MHGQRAGAHLVRMDSRSKDVPLAGSELATSMVALGQTDHGFQRANHGRRILTERLGNLELILNTIMCVTSDVVAGVAQNLVELPVTQIGIPLRDAHLLVDHKLRQVATSCESMPNLLLCKGLEPSHHNRRVRIQLEDRAVHEAEDGEWS